MCAIRWKLGARAQSRAGDVVAGRLEGLLELSCGRRGRRGAGDGGDNRRGWIDGDLYRGSGSTERGGMDARNGESKTGEGERGDSPGGIGRGKKPIGLAEGVAGRGEFSTGWTEERERERVGLDWRCSTYYIANCCNHGRWGRRSPAARLRCPPSTPSALLLSRLEALPLLALNTPPPPSLSSPSLSAPPPSCSPRGRSNTGPSPSSTHTSTSDPSFSPPYFFLSS